MTDPYPCLGGLVDWDRPRDSIHIAIIPVVAAYDIRPGGLVALNAEGRGVPTDLRYESIGIVDPFLAVGPTQGQRFWLLLHPGSVTGLRHHWTTAEFPEEGPPTTEEQRRAARRWLYDFANESRIDCDDLIALAASGEGATFGVDCHGPLFKEMGQETADLFWNYLEVVTGTKFPTAHREGTHFSCACNG